MTNYRHETPHCLIYFLYSPEKRLIKIGTTRHLRTRLGEHRNRHGKLQLLGLEIGSYTVERELHDMFDEHRDTSRYYGSPSEWFHPHKELWDYIRRNTARPETMMPLLEIAKQRKVAIADFIRDGILSLLQDGETPYEAGLRLRKEAWAVLQPKQLPLFDKDSTP